MNRNTLSGQGVTVSFDVTLELPGFVNLRYMPITTYDVEISSMLSLCGKISPILDFLRNGGRSKSSAKTPRTGHEFVVVHIL